MIKAAVRAYCQEEFSAATNKIVRASRLRVIRFAQFLLPQMSSVALPAAFLHDKTAGFSKSALSSLTHPRSICWRRTQHPDALHEPEETRTLLPRAQIRNDDEQPLFRAENCPLPRPRSFSIDVPPLGCGFHNQFPQYYGHFPVFAQRPKNRRLLRRPDLHPVSGLSTVLSSIKLRKRSLPCLSVSRYNELAAFYAAPTKETQNDCESM